MIAEATFKKLLAQLPMDCGYLGCGVVGIGNIGKAVAEGLQQLGHKVFVYDKEPSLAASVPGTVWCSGIREVFVKSQYIFGCTGEDVVENSGWIDDIRGERVLISCSSEDKEFLALLKLVYRQGTESYMPFRAVRCQLMRSTMTIIRGGFPANFDGTPESVPALDIQMTRGLLGAIIQAVLCAQGDMPEGGDALMLDPWLQKFVVWCWMRQRQLVDPASASLVQNTFSDIRWIIEYSGGHMMESVMMRDLFGSGPA